MSKLPDSDWNCFKAASALASTSASSFQVWVVADGAGTPEVASGAGVPARADAALLPRPRPRPPALQVKCGKIADLNRMRTR